MRVIILGPPLSGKGTQSKLLAERLRLPCLSVGALIRKLYRQKKKEGLEANRFMIKGEAIPAKLFLKIVKPWLITHQKGFIIDNLVRTNKQLEVIKKYFQEKKIKIDCVIYLTLPKKEVFKRQKIRIAEHQMTKRVREDETKQALETRIKVYQSSLKEILTYFKSQKIPVYQVSANQSVEKVYEDILDKLKIEINDDN